jgi:hypothetical protein
MRLVDEGYLLLVRSGRTPHALPLHPPRGDPLEPRVREELQVLSRARKSSPAPVRAVSALAGLLAGLRRRDTELGA